jgi:Mg2+ and Co2+ transporter CorA
MSRTRSYSKAASMLRQYHDTLSTTLDRIHDFLKQNEDTFNYQKDFQDQCGCYMRIIDIEYTHLTRWRRRLHERMQRFDMMRDGLLNVSVLRESRRSTQQAADIGLLTKVTVLFLPVSLASGIFGLSSIPPERTVWLWWALLSVVLSLATFYVAVGHKYMLRVLGSCGGTRRRAKT